jgi:hypothetical protein
VGDFNLIRRPSDRNKLGGGDMQDMLSFNAAISNQHLEELKLSENKFTWTNKQSSPILERLDWFFATLLGWQIILGQLFQHCLGMYLIIHHA